MPIGIIKKNKTPLTPFYFWKAFIWVNILRREFTILLPRYICLKWAIWIPFASFWSVVIMWETCCFDGQRGYSGMNFPSMIISKSCILPYTHLNKTGQSEHLNWCNHDILHYKQEQRIFFFTNELTEAADFSKVAITQSQNCRGSKGPLRITKSNPPTETGSL